MRVAVLHTPNLFLDKFLHKFTLNENNNIMRFLILVTSLFWCSTIFSQGSGSITYPYNPDGNGDEIIASPDLLDVLSVYGGEFTPTEILIDGETLGDYLLNINSLIEAFSTGSSDGEFLRWNEDAQQWQPELILQNLEVSEISVNDDAYFFSGVVFTDDVAFNGNIVTFNSQVAFADAINFTNDVQVFGDLNLYEGLYVSDTAHISNLHVIEPALFDASVTMNQNVTLKNEVSVTGQTVFDIKINQDSIQSAHPNQNAQNIIDTYPVLIKGSKQGLAINLEPSLSSNVPEDYQSHRGNNYISFWRDDQQTGRIEAMGTSDLSMTGLTNIFAQILQAVPTYMTGVAASVNPFDSGYGNRSMSGVDLSTFITLESGSLPAADLNVGSLPSLTSGSLPASSLNTGSLPSLSFSEGSLPSLGFDGIIPYLNAGSLPSSSLDAGSLPSLSFSAGSFPSLLQGSLPSLAFQSGSLPTIEFNSFESILGDITNPIGTSVMLEYNSLIDDLAVPPSQSNRNSAINHWENIKTTMVNSGIYNEEDVYNYDSQVFSDFTLDVTTQVIECMEEYAHFTLSFYGIADPQDIANDVISMITRTSTLIMYMGYQEENLGVAYESGSGDYAEWLLKANPDEIIKHGEVVGVVGGKISKTFDNAKKFMVVSTSPIVLGNMPESKEIEKISEKIAFMGQVPVNVIGKVEIGDYILPSGQKDGLAIAVHPVNMKAKDYQRIVGVAWSESHSDKYVNMINTAVGINQNDMSSIINQMQLTLNKVQASVQSLDPNYMPDVYDVSSIYDDHILDVTTNSVAASHPSKLKNYYQLKSNSQSQEFKVEDLKLAIKELIGVDVKDYPMIDYIISNPDKREELNHYFTMGINTLSPLAKTH